jgi:hypothetical protein
MSTRLLRITPRSSLVTITADRTLDRAYRVDAGGPQPRVRETDDVVALDYSVAGRLRSLVPRSRLDVALNPRVSWAIELRGGVSGLRAGLSTLSVTSIRIGGGASDISLDLPEPTGRLTVEVAGGLSSSIVRRPAAAPISVRIDGGATGLRLDGERLAPADATVRHRIHDAEAAGEVVLHVRGGASGLTVERAGRAAVPTRITPSERWSGRSA